MLFSSKWGVLPGLLLVSILALTLAILFPASNHQSQQGKGYLPWNIESLESGTIRVFGLTLEESTLADVESIFKEPAVVTLFSKEGSPPKLEAYLNSTSLAGLKARLVIVLSLHDVEIAAIRARGSRIAKLGKSEYKITLDDSDRNLVRGAKVASLTYLPIARLSAELIQARFGEPNSKVVEAETSIEHWLYPEKGIDIALEESGKAIIQYLPPHNFSLISQPLLPAPMVSN